MKSKTLNIILILFFSLASTSIFAKVMYLNDYSDRNFVDLNKEENKRKSNENILALKNPIKDISDDKINFVKLARDLNYVNVLIDNKNTTSVEIVNFDEIVNSFINADIKNISMANSDNNNKRSIFKNIAATIAGSKLGFTVYDLGGFFKFNVGYDVNSNKNFNNARSIDSQINVPGLIINSTTTTTTTTSSGGNGLMNFYNQ